MFHSAERAGRSRWWRVALVATVFGAMSWSARPVGAADAPAPVEPTPEAIHKADPIPTIDGKLDEPCWAKAAAIPVIYVQDSRPPRKMEEVPMTARYLWDEHYLYIGYEVFDSHLVTLGKGTKKGPPDNQREPAEIWKHGSTDIDVVEFFVSVLDPRFFWELHHNGANQFNEMWMCVPDKSWPISKSSNLMWGILDMKEQYLRDDDEYKLATAVALKPKKDGTPGAVNDGKHDGTGYTAELRIPWFGLGVAQERRVMLTKPNPDPKGQPIPIPGPWKIKGLELSILAVLQNGDLKDRYLRSNPTKTGGFFHYDFAGWPRYKLDD